MSNKQIYKLRRELSGASLAGKGEAIKDLSGISSPKNAVEVVIMYLALDVLRGNGKAGPALASLKEWHGSS